MRVSGGYIYRSSGVNSHFVEPINSHGSTEISVDICYPALNLFTLERIMTATAKTILAGKYRHYKGQEYQVFGVARHSERDEWLVNYRCLYGDYSYWVRPFDMFVGDVTVDGIEQPRFAYVGPMNTADLAGAL